MKKRRYELLLVDPVGLATESTYIYNKKLIIKHIGAVWIVKKNKQ